MGWIGLWRHLRRSGFERAVVTILQHINFESHLREPRRGHVGANTLIVGQKDARAAYGRGHIDLLNELTARIMAKARNVPRSIIFRRTNIEAIERARRIV